MKKLLVLIFCAVFLCSCASGINPQTANVFAFDTVNTLNIDGDTEVLNSIEQLILDLDDLWSITKPNSDISKLNSNINFIPDEKTAYALEVSGIYSKKTNGAFDIKINGVYDLGGIAKGIACDYVLDILNKQGVNSALISLGGNILIKGAKPNNQSFKIGLRDPNKTANDYFGYLTLTDLIIATSGDYERSGHILDPSTGVSAATDILSVSVVCANGAMSDAYSTALYVMGLSKSLEFYEHEKNFEAVFVIKNNRVIVTPGLKENFTLTNKDYIYED